MLLKQKSAVFKEVCIGLHARRQTIFEGTPYFLTCLKDQACLLFNSRIAKWRDHIQISYVFH